MDFTFGRLVDSKIRFESVNISPNLWNISYVVVERLQFGTKGIKKTQAWRDLHLHYISSPGLSLLSIRAKSVKLPLLAQLLSSSVE